MTLDLLRQLAAALAAQFGEDCEIVIHDLTRKSLAKSVVWIEHGEVTGRRIGDGPSRIVLETLRADPARVQDQLGYLSKTEDGKILKSSTIFVRETPDGPIQYIFGINYDITRLIYGSDAVNALIRETPGSAARKEPEKIRTNVEALLDDLISQAIAMAGKPVSLMTKEDKKAVVRFLNESGAFLITRSGEKVAQLLGISKYTLYNYMKQDDS